MNTKWQAFLATREFKSVPLKELLTNLPGNTPLPSLCPTNRYSIVEISGNDCATFLQGQTTCDVLGLQPGHATMGAFCNPKGRVLTTFFLYGHEQGYRLILPQSLVSSIEKKLRMYVLRSKVVIENISDSCAIFGISCESLPDSIQQVSDRSNEARYPMIEAENGQILKTGANQWLYIGAPDDAERRWTGFVENDGLRETTEDLWNLLSILNGVPVITPETSEEFVPQMINLDALGGISFKKGCYTGQEIVARMHYLGKLKRRMALAETRSDRLPAPGEPVCVSNNEQSVGQVVNAAWLDTTEIRLLLVLQIDQIESDSIRLANSSNSPIKILELPYTF